MRGLSDQQRSLLLALRSCTPIEAEPDDETTQSLIRRGVFDDRGPNGIGGRVYKLNSLGALALRVDAAARAAGVWP